MKTQIEITKEELEKFAKSIEILENLINDSKINESESYISKETEEVFICLDFNSSIVFNEQIRKDIGSSIRLANKILHGKESIMKKVLEKI